MVKLTYRTKPAPMDLIEQFVKKNKGKTFTTREIINKFENELSQRQVTAAVCGLYKRNILCNIGKKNIGGSVMVVYRYVEDEVVE